MQKEFESGGGFLAPVAEFRTSPHFARVSRVRMSEAVPKKGPKLVKGMNPRVHRCQHLRSCLDLTCGLEQPIVGQQRLEETLGGRWGGRGGEGFSLRGFSWKQKGANQTCPSGFGEHGGQPM